MNKTPPQMKFWEITSGFRDDPEIVAAVFADARWREPYLGHLNNMDELVSTQRREVLDSLVPLELSREIARRYRRLFYFSPEQKFLRADAAFAPGDIQMTALEVHDRFGGSIIEEVMEYGCAKPASDVV